MWQYIARRLLQTIPTIIGVSIIITLVFRMAPGDFLDSNMKITEERKAELREQWGLNKPLPEYYWNWVKNIAHGDLGDSMKFKAPVTTVIKTYMWNSFYLALVALILSYLIALFVGVLSATKQYSWFDSIVTVLVLAAMSLPSFFIGLLMIKWFAIDLKLLPVGGMTTTGSAFTGLKHLFDVGKHMILPALVLTMLSVGSLTRYFRTSMIEVVRQDYVRTARAKGLRERTVIFKHALRNALLPVITLLGLELPGLFSGAIILEKIFAWPGIGRINLEAIGVRDYPLLMGFTMFLAILTIIGNLLADVFYAAADPRIRLD
ncbi:ABC transporter permease [Gorillibacterium sp. sgz500922]|uniref:ABC transporter permease n=1 Tax=Gorillibacterium sp. sgz500922 TaxID=3446694 RepID=UPI003F663EF5